MSGDLRLGQMWDFHLQLKLRGLVIDALINEGKHSMVYRATDSFVGNNSVIIKCHHDKSATAFSSHDCRREAAIWSQLSHKNIVRYYSVIQLKATFCLIAEYIQGPNLLNYMVQLPDHLVPLPLAKRWIWKLSDVVDYLHNTCSIAHRDIKLENILVDQTSWAVKLCDFGFAKKVTDGAKDKRACGSTSYVRNCSHDVALHRNFQNYSRSRVPPNLERQFPYFLSLKFILQLGYAAPQIILGGPYNAKAGDIWSLGCVFYALLTGGLPFSDTVSISTQLAMQKHQVFEWNHGYRYSFDTRSLLEWMLRFQEGTRATAADLLQSQFVIRSCCWLESSSSKAIPRPTDRTTKVLNTEMNIRADRGLLSTITQNDANCVLI